MGYRTRQTVQKYETLKEMFKILSYQKNSNYNYFEISFCTNENGQGK